MKLTGVLLPEHPESNPARETCTGFQYWGSELDLQALSFDDPGDCGKCIVFFCHSDFT